MTVRTRLAEQIIPPLSYPDAYGDAPGDDGERHAERCKGIPVGRKML